MKRLETFTFELCLLLGQENLHKLATMRAKRYVTYLTVTVTVYGTIYGCNRLHPLMVPILIGPRLLLLLPPIPHKSLAGLDLR